MKSFFFIALAAATAVGTGLALAQEKRSQPGPAAAKADAATEPIRTVSASFVKAYNAKDARALGGLFTEGAEIEDDDGTVTQGRDAIVARFARRFAEGESGTLAVSIESIHFLSPTLAVEQGTATTKTAAAESNRYSVLYLKQDGRWLHARIKDEASAPASASQQLKELDWMLGEWVNESDDAVVSTSCDWSDDGSFLVRKFDIRIEGAITLKGTQRIGWDPLLKQFRTWVFDTDGGFAEGLMARDGDRWVVKMSGVRTDGQAASATSTITRLGPDRLGWHASDRTLGGVAVPGSERFVMVRKPPAPGR